MKALEVTSDPFLKDYNSYIRLNKNLQGTFHFQMYLRLQCWLYFSLKDNLRFIFMLRCIPKLLKRRVTLQELFFLH